MVEMRKMKMMLAVLAMLTVMVAGALPAALAQGAQEIAVSGVLEYQGIKADGTPVYGIVDESKALAFDGLSGKAIGTGYLLEGDYSAYLGQRITVHGIPGHDHEMSVLDVTWID